MAQTLEIVPISKIKVGQRFRAEMGDLDELASSIREKGLIQPITIDTHFNLLAGGRRIAAAQKVGLLEIPCIKRKSESAIDALEIELFENIHRKDFSWQERCAAEKTLIELKGKSDPLWGVRAQARETEVSPAAVSRRLELASAVEAFPQLAECKTEDDAWKAYKKIEERLITDSIVNGAKAKALKGVKIADSNYKVGDVFAGIERLKPEWYHFAEVDPPYGVDLDHRKSRARDNSTMGEYHELDRREYTPFISRLAQETYRVLADHSFAVWWFGMSWYTDTLACLRESGFYVSDIPAIWTKGAQGQTASPDTMLGSSYEPFFVCRKGDAKLARPGRSNVFDYAPLSPSQKIHPTEKPQPLMVELLEVFTFPGTRIVVPLLGSGSTLRACYRTGRIGFGWDLSAEHKKRFLGRVVEDEEAGLYEVKP